jgi:hypothetical protein
VAKDDQDRAHEQKAEHERGTEQELERIDEEGDADTAAPEERQRMPDDQQREEWEKGEEEPPEEVRERMDDDAGE